LEIRISSPELTDKLGSQLINANTEALPLGQILDILGDSIGVTHRIDRAARQLMLTPTPTDESPESLTARRAVALRHLLRGAPDPSDTNARASFLIAAARVHAANGDTDDALNSLHGFLKEQPEHIKTPEMALEGARLALRANRPTESQAFLDFFMAEFAGHARTTEAEILFARALLAEHDVRRARLFLERLSKRSERRLITHREGLVAELLLAGLLLQTNDLAAGISLLSEIPARHPSNQEGDLYNQLPLLRGIFHRRLGEHDQAIYHFQMAVAHSTSADVRSRALIELGHVYLSLNLGVQCIAACRMARELEPNASMLNEIRRLRGRGFARLGLGRRAISELVAALETLPQQEDQGQETAAAIMNEIAAVLVDVDEREATRGIFVRLQSVPEQADRAIFMTALTDHHDGKSQRALKELRRLDHVTPGGSPLLYSEITKLTGDCLMAAGEFERALRAWKGNE
jgi:tetratricopeptide (TPR) repeat protein